MLEDNQFKGFVYSFTLVLLFAMVLVMTITTVVNDDLNWMPITVYILWFVAGAISLKLALNHLYENYVSGSFNYWGGEIRRIAEEAGCQEIVPSTAKVVSSRGVHFLVAQAE